MRLLLDTHAFLWWLDGDASLSLIARETIADEANEVFLSAASAWEITTKHRLGKLPGAALVAADVAACVAGQGFLELPITLAHAQIAGSLAGPRRDPFDRMLIAQAMVESLVLVSNELAFDAYGARRLW
jgi:PIN domain nuclease of toxin-antitoxin system